MAEEFDLYDSLNNPDSEWREGYTMHAAQFTMADDETLNELRKIVGEAGYFDNIMLYELRKIDPSETFRLKLYEALYFLLNGTRRAIWGGDCFFSDGSELDFDPFEEFSINRNADLPEIVKELENVNINELEENFDLEIFKKVNLYPRLVWNECTREELLKALSKSYYGLLDFYRRVKEKNANVIIELYGYYRFCGEDSETEEYIDFDDIKKMISNKNQSRD